MLKILAITFSLIWDGTTQGAETVLKHDDIVSVLTDAVLHATDNSNPAEQIFQKSGVTFFSAGGNQSQGTWSVVGDKYCSTWPPNPALSCYDIVRDGDKVTFIDKSGKRYEMSLDQ